MRIADARVFDVALHVARVGGARRIRGVESCREPKCKQQACEETIDWSHMRVCRRPESLSASLRTEHVPAYLPGRRMQFDQSWALSHCRGSAAHNDHNSAKNGH